MSPKFGDQISTRIGESTRDMLEQYCAKTGVKKGHLIEQALLHHLEALQELPADVIIPPQLVVAREQWEALKELLDNPPAPTPAMSALMAEPED